DPAMVGRSLPIGLRILVRPAITFYLGFQPQVQARVYQTVDEVLPPRVGIPAFRVAVLDELQLRQQPEALAAIRHLYDLMATETVYIDHLNGPTLLDADPAAAYGSTTLGHRPGFASVWDGSKPNPDSQSARIWVIPLR